jgi:hypothetical protein
MRFARLGALLIAVGLLTASAQVSALTLPITGGPGLDQGEICPSLSLCPGTPFLTLLNTAAVTGTITYNSGPGTVDIAVTLAAAGNFGGVQVLPGTTITANAIPVLNIPLGGGAYLLVQNGAAAGLAAPLLLSPAFPIVANTPAISGLSCTVGTGSDQCGFSAGPGGLTFNAAGTDYDAFLSFNVNVPEPTTMSLIGLGVLGLAWAGGKRA